MIHHISYIFSDLTNYDYKNLRLFLSLGVEFLVFMQFKLVNLFLLILYLITVIFGSTITDTSLCNFKSIMREKIISPI